MKPQDSAIEQARAMMGKMMNANFGKMNPSMLAQKTPVALLNNGFILHSDGSMSMAPTAQLANQIQDQAAFFPNASNQNLPLRLGQGNLESAIPVAQAGAATIQQSAPFGNTSTPPQEVLQSITKNGATQDNLNIPGVNTTLPQDPVVSYYSRVLRNNPTIQAIFGEYGQLPTEQNADPGNDFTQYDRQTTQPLTRQLVNQYQNFMLRAPSQGIPDTAQYGGANAFNARIY